MSRCPVRHDIISHLISNCFAAYGRFLSRHPWIVLILTVGVGIFLSTGIKRLKVISLEMEDFTPQDSRALKDRVALKEFEEIKNSGALPTDNGNETNCRYGEVVFVANKGVNLFTLRALIDILSIENQLWAESVPSSVPGVNFTYNQTCHRVNNACFGPTMRLFATFVPQLRDLLNMDPSMATDPAFADFMEVSIIETGVELTYPYYHGQFIAATLSEVIFRAPKNESVPEDPFAALLPANSSAPVGSWGIIESVGVFREVYLACFDLGEREAGENWDTAFDRILKAESNKDHMFKLYWHSNKRSEANIVATALKLIPLFCLTLVALAFFSMVATLWGDAVSSKPCLGFLGIVITGFAIFSSFGLMAWLEQPFVTIAIATPFLALAVGLDDMHVLLAGWRLTDRRLPVWRRMEETLREAGTSIFITFLTNMIGFVIGTYMPYPAIQKLSLFTTAAMCLDFGFQLTLFCSCLVLFGRLEAANRHSLLPCVKVTQPMISFKNSVSSAIFCGSRHISDYQLIKSESGAATITTPVSLTPPTTSPSTSRSSSAGVDIEADGGKTVKAPSSSSKKQQPMVATDDGELDTDSSAISDFFANVYSPALLSRAGKFVVLLLYIGYLIRISFGIGQLEVGFRAENLFPRESTSYYWYLMIRGHFRSYWPQIPVIFTSQLDYANPNVQEELEELFQKLESSKFLWDREVTRFWLLEYLPFYHEWTSNGTSNKALFLNGTIPTTTIPVDVDSTALMKTTTTPYPPVMPSEEQFYYLFKNRFLLMQKYKSYESDVIWNWNESAIIRSRGWVVGKNLSNPDNERQLLHDIRELIEGFRLGPIAAFSIDFILYEQHASIVYNCMYNVLIAIAAVLITSGVMAPYLSCMFWLAVCLISIVLGLFGFMSDCNIDLDSVSMVTIIIGVGFSTDFIAHFTYGYLMDSGKSTRAKADGALRDVGSATVPTAIGTIMSVLAMSSSTLYVYVVFFKMMSLTIALCALHSLVFLPVILSMLGPLPSTTRNTNNGSAKNNKDDKGTKVVIHHSSSKDVVRSKTAAPHKSKSEPNFSNETKSRSKSVSSASKEVQPTGTRPVSDGMAVMMNGTNKSGTKQGRQKRPVPDMTTSVSAVFTAAGVSGAATTASTTLSGSASAGEDQSNSDLSIPSSRRHFIVHEFGMTAKSAADRDYEATMLGANDADMQLDHPATSAEKVRAYLHQINRQKPTFTI